MAAIQKRRTPAKPGSEQSADIAETPAALADAAPDKSLPAAAVGPGASFADEPSDPFAGEARGYVNGSQAPARPPGRGAVLLDAQVRTLRDLCVALDRKCIALLDELAAARNAQAEAAQELAAARAAHERQLADLRHAHDNRLAESHRTQATLERELASARLVLERVNRAAAERARAALEADAARLLPLLEERLAAGTVVAVHDTLQALAQFGAAGMVDALEDGRDAPICQGWLLSRSDLPVEPLMFLFDDAGLLGWTDGGIDRPDVNLAFEDTRPRPGFRLQFTRVPIGRVRGIVGLTERGSGAATFFEASSQAIPDAIVADSGA